MSLGFVDRRQTSGTKSLSVGTPANYTSESAMRTRLAALDPTYYTTKRLQAMNENDLTYALRLKDDAASVK